MIRWTIQKWTSQDRRQNDGNVSETFERGRGSRFTLTGMSSGKYEYTY